jgi:phosphomannomutase
VEVAGNFLVVCRDDALFATLLFLKILSQSDQSASALLADIPYYPITPDLRLPCPPREQAAILTELTAAFVDHEISTIDGVRVAFEGGWVLARSSVGTHYRQFEGRPDAARNSSRGSRTRARA